MKCSVLKVLMWKHFTVRKRRYIHSFVEFSTPVFFFAIMFAFKNVIMPVPSISAYAGVTGVEETEPLTLAKVREPFRIFYHPDEYLPGLLMDKVGKQLNKNRLSDLEKLNKWSSGYYGFSNKSQLEKTVIQASDAVVIFHNLYGQEWPSTLNYTIRMKGDFNTERIEPVHGTFQPHSTFGSTYEPFMNLQWAVDTSYIDVSTNQPITQNLTFQEFPYYKRLDNKVITMICTILNIMCVLSLILVFVFLVCRLLEERSSGIQELTKMVGVPSNILGISHFLNVLPGGLVYAVVGTLLLKVTSNPLIPNTNGIYIFILLILHFVSVVSMAFACSYLAKGTRYSITIALFSYAALGMPSIIVAKYELPRFVLYLTGLLPHQPMVWFWDEVGASEEFDDGITITSLVKSYGSKSACVLLSYFMLILQSAIFFSLTWYLNLVRPGKYGQALPWLFMFKRNYWSKNEILPDDVLDSSDTELITSSPGTSYGEAKFFEKPDHSLEVGIKIVNVSKAFPDQLALDKVTLDVYKNEITVLLGHNGAGKTTLMSIITGMLSATRGSVFVNGHDTVSAADEVRRHLGLCPQHNLFFSDLTVLEHVMFFTLLKGTTFKKAEKSSKELLSDLGLTGKDHSKCSELSGGMKRRLQLACALAGDADVLVLDEPTSGLDVETRRSLWDLLLGLRGSRTVLVSTHFMEEAEALGDRAAALHRGQLVCHATPMHLKRAMGTGYRLTLTTEGTPMEAKVTELVKNHVPLAITKDQTVNSLTYSLPASESKKFEQLFSELEDKRYELKINSMGVGISTLEEVFLKLCSDVDHTWTNPEKNGNGGLNETPEYVKYTGGALYARQLLALLKRQARYVMSKKYSFLILQVILPIAFLFGFTYLFNNDVVESGPTNPSRTLNLDLYKHRQDLRVLYKAQDVSALVRRHPDVQFEYTSDVYGAILDYAKKDIWDYSKYLIGIELNETDVKVWFTTTVRHAAPVALASVVEVLAGRGDAGPGPGPITTAIWPLDSTHTLEPNHAYTAAKAQFLAIAWAVASIFLILSTSINVLSLVCKERVWGSRHVLVMSGCPPELHWAATLLWHLLLCVVFLLTPLLIAAATLDTDHTINQPRFLFSFLVVLLLGCLSFFSFMYLVSFKLDDRSAGGFLAAYVIVFCFVTPLIQTSADMVKEEVNSFVAFLLAVALYVTSPHALMMAAARTVRVARLNAMCTLNLHLCPNIPGDDGFDAEACCAGHSPRCYMCLEENAPGKEMIIMAVQFVVFMSCVLVLSRGVFRGVWERVVNARYVPHGAEHSASATDPGAPPDPVRAAAEYVSHAIKLTPNRQDAMLVHDVHKNYFSVFGKSCNAVRGVSFAVKKGECFGLLGVNGAGKSTTFKMLTAEECPTTGSIYGNGYHLDKHPGPYLRTLGYCPQFNGLDRFLTGEQNLELLLTMRGLSPHDAQKETDSWLEILGLQHVRGRPLASYSGGCGRRLGAGAALAAGGALALLDEPTAGVDVAARRRLWAAVARARDQGRALLLSSHSMDETEALCSTIGIMSAGRLRALGSAPELRAAHAAGHAVLLQLARGTTTTDTTDQVDGTKSRVNELKGSLNSTFVGTVKDEHQTMLRYHINDQMRYSELFEKLELLKRQYQGLVEDYSVTETTLEEVFLAFAKETQDPETTV